MPDSNIAYHDDIVYDMVYDIICDIVYDVICDVAVKKKIMPAGGCEGKTGKTKKGKRIYSLSV